MYHPFLELLAGLGDGITMKPYSDIIIQHLPCGCPTARLDQKVEPGAMVSRFLVVVAPDRQNSHQMIRVCLTPACPRTFHVPRLH